MIRLTCTDWPSPIATPTNSGCAAEIAARGVIEVCARYADAPFLYGETHGPPPHLADWERLIFEQVSRQ